MRTISTSILDNSLITVNKQRHCQIGSLYWPLHWCYGVGFNRKFTGQRADSFATQNTRKVLLSCANSAKGSKVLGNRFVERVKD